MMTLRKAGIIAKEIGKAAVSAAAGSAVAINLGKSNPLGLDEGPNILVSTLVGCKVYDECQKALDDTEFLIRKGGEKIGNKIADKKAAKAAKKEDE